MIGPHLHLDDSRVFAPSSVGGSTEPPTAWAALCAAHASVGQKPTSQILVRERGLEPPRIAPLVPKTNAATNYATRAEHKICVIKIVS